MTIWEKIYSKYKNIKSKIKEKYDSLNILDKYVLKQLLDVFTLGVIIVTSIIFASGNFT